MYYFIIIIIISIYIYNLNLHLKWFTNEGNISNQKSNNLWPWTTKPVIWVIFFNLDLCIIWKLNK